jgi:hypothetical protein
MHRRGVKLTSRVRLLHDVQTRSAESTSEAIVDRTHPRWYYCCPLYQTDDCNPWSAIHIDSNYDHRFSGVSLILGRSWREPSDQKFLCNSTHHAFTFTDQEVAEDQSVSPV